MTEITTMEENAIKDINNNLFFIFTKSIMESKDFHNFVKSKRKYETEARTSEQILERFSDCLQDLTEYLKRGWQ